MHLSAQAFKKLCQCVALVGVLSIHSTWQTFIPDILSLEQVRILLDVIDCVPFCVEEFSMSQKFMDSAKDRIKESELLILDTFDRIIETRGHFNEVLQVLKSWSSITLPLLAHSKFYGKIHSSFLASTECWGEVCDSLVNSLVDAPYANLLAKEKFRPSTDYMLLIPDPDRANLHSLVLMVCGILPGALLEYEERFIKKLAELVSCLCTHYIFLLLDSRYMGAMWDTVKLLLTFESTEVVQTVGEFLYDLKRNFTKHIKEGDFPPVVFDYLLRIVESLAAKCIYTSRQHYLDSVFQSTMQDEMSFQRFRLSTEDCFENIYRVFQFHHKHKGRALLAHVAQLAIDGDEFKCEVFTYILKSVLTAAMDDLNSGVLKEIVTTVLQLTVQPLVVKGVLFLLIDLCSCFKDMPELFPSALNYVFANGLLTQWDPYLKIDSNAVECFFNFSYECSDLIDRDMVASCIDTYERTIRRVDGVSADKFVEAILNVISRLSEEEISFTIRRTMIVVHNDFRTVELGPTEVCEDFSRYMHIWASALNSLVNMDSNSLFPILQDMINDAVSIAAKGISFYSGTTNAVYATAMFYKKLIKSLSVHADLYADTMLSSVVSAYSPGREVLLNVVVAAISALGTEPNTHNWISRHFSTFVGSLMHFIQQTYESEMITQLFEFLIKTLETGHPAAETSQIFVSSLELGIKCLSVVRNRNPSKSVLSYMEFLYEQQKEIKTLNQYAKQVICSVVLGLSNIHQACHQFVAKVLGAVKKRYEEQYSEGVVEALKSAAFSDIGETGKSRILHCFWHIDAYEIYQLKNLSSIIANILKKMGTIDSLIATEIAIASANSPIPIIEIKT